MEELINMNKAIKRSILFMETRVEIFEQVKVALNKINRSIKVGTCHGARRIYHINDINVKDDIQKILQESGYNVEVRFYGGGKVKFIISW